MSTTIREDILSGISTALEAMTGVGAVVVNEFETVDNVRKSNMPHVMVIPAVEERERVGASRWTECTWEIDVWCYLSTAAQIEEWVEKLRSALMSNLTWGGKANDTMLTTIMTAPIGAMSELGLAILTIEVTHRVRE